MKYVLLQPFSQIQYSFVIKENRPESGSMIIFHLTVTEGGLSASAMVASTFCSVASASHGSF